MHQSKTNCQDYLLRFTKPLSTYIINISFTKGIAVASGRKVAKTILLILLIIILILGGMVWFDFLGVTQTKTQFAPLYRLFGLEPQTKSSVATVQDIGSVNLDNDRLAKRLEALNIRSEELDKREEDIFKKEQENVQILAELDNLRASQEERERTFTDMTSKFDDREENIAQNARNLNAMPPKNAVQILVAMDDQDIIDVLRKAEQIAAEEGTSSLVAYWLSLMPADRVAQIQRKMTNKPLALP